MVLAVGDNGSEASTLPSTALCNALLQQRAAEPGIGQSGFNLDHGCAELLIGQPLLSGRASEPAVLQHSQGHLYNPVIYFSRGIAGVTSLGNRFSSMAKRRAVTPGEDWHCPAWHGFGGGGLSGDTAQPGAKTARPPASTVRPHTSRRPHRPHARISADHATALAALEQARHGAEPGPRPSETTHIARSADAALSRRFRVSTATLCWMATFSRPASAATGERQRLHVT